MKIAIRFGHMLKNVDTGAVGYMSETDINRKYGAALIKDLQNAGHEVLNVTPPEGSCKNLTESLYYGIHKANNAGANLFISCHANANVTTSNPMGCEVVYNGSSTNKALADSICSELSKLGLKNRGAKTDERGLAEIRSCKMPCYIVEPLFVDSKADIDLYNKVGAAGIATAISNAVTGRKSISTPAVTSYKQGSSGDVVKEIQTILNKIGLRCGTPDGKFGVNTDKAIRLFQQKYKLTVDGVVGPATLKKLESFK